MFRIGEFAALSRVSQRMLRHYDAIGLLKPEITDARTGYRFYSAAQLPELNRIVALRDMGFSLSEIERLQDARLAPEELRDLLLRRRADLHRRVRDDTQRLAQLRAWLAALDRDESFSVGDVVLRGVPGALMATRRATVDAFGEAVEELFDETEAYVARFHARSDSSPLLLFHSDLARRPVDVEVAVPLDRHIPSTPHISIRNVEGAEHMACLVYRGGYHQTDLAVDTLRKWSDASSWRFAGSVREVYLRFGADDAEALALPARFLAAHAGEYVTEVQVPVTSA